MKNELHVEPVKDEVGIKVKLAAKGHAPNHANTNRLTAMHKKIVVEDSVHNGYQVGTVVAVCAGAVTTFLLILVVILAVRRRANYLAAGGAASLGGRGYHMSVVDQVRWIV